MKRKSHSLSGHRQLSSQYQSRIVKITDLRVKNNMKRIIGIGSVGVILVLSCSILILSIGSHNQEIVSSDSDELTAIIAYQQNLANKGVSNFGVWPVGSDEKLYYLIKKVPADKGASSDELLRIYDDTHKLIYEERANAFSGIEPFNILRQPKKQLVIKSVNYGGSGRFFKILDFQNGSVISLTNNDDTMYSGDIEILPQYQDDVKYFSVPYQILLNEYGSSPSAEATVLRYLNGRYVAVGKVSQLDVGNFIYRRLLKSSDKNY